MLYEQKKVMKMLKGKYFWFCFLSNFSGELRRDILKHFLEPSIWTVMGFSEVSETLMSLLPALHLPCAHCAHTGNTADVKRMQAEWQTLKFMRPLGGELEASVCH